ncbi:MAG: ankyrin repeat domain-containing protein [Vicinamibacterales bacterium]
MVSLIVAVLLAATPLVDAVRADDAAAVVALIEQGADVNAAEPDGATALHWAAYLDQADVVTRLLDAGAEAGVANDLAVTPLHLAAANGNLAIVRALLAHGADPDAATEAGVTPLMEAARRGSAAVAGELLAKGADVNARESSRGQTALMWAAAGRHPAVVRVLLEHRPDVGARTKTRELTVMLDQGPRRTVKTSVQDARPIERGGSTALLFAAQEGATESAKLLLAAGADVNDTAADGRSALVLAAFSGHGEVARALLDAGADPDADGAGYTALHAAALRGDVATVKALLARGADPNARLTNGSPVRRFGSQWALSRAIAGATPLLVAAAYLEVPIVRALLDGGADPSLGLPDGTTPLLAAAGARVEVLTRPTDLERWNMVDSDQPVAPRAEGDVLAAVTALADRGADVNAATEEGNTALHEAAATGLTTVIKVLAAHGAALDAKNKQGQTPLDLTLPIPPIREGFPPVSPGYPEAEALLRQLGATGR